MFAWKKELELGIEIIDNQHKRLLEIGDKVHDLVETHGAGDDDYEEILSVLLELKDYTIYHFKTEEELFLKYDYEGYEIHKREHDEFIKYVESINLNEMRENQGDFLRDLLKEVGRWIFRHIMTTDFLYKDYLASVMPK